MRRTNDAVVAHRSHDHPCDQILVVGERRIVEAGGHELLLRRADDMPTSTGSRSRNEPTEDRHRRRSDTLIWPEPEVRLHGAASSVATFGFERH